MGDSYENFREEIDREPSAQELKAREEAAKLAREGKAGKGIFGPIVPLPAMDDPFGDEEK
ncbi:hypothetical protein [Streptomyces syringium]|uniref:hypothetical protein n=1 Tax=Streptomyces syringium TaxID=76729 RepID=UPI0033A814E4